MNELKIFKNAEFGEVRTILINDTPYFVGKDIAETLEYSNPRKAIIDHVDEEDKGITKCDTRGGKQDMTIINESGLYSLILSSKMPKAKKFKKWVTSEVLPSIRKHGLYATNDLLNNPDLLIEAGKKLKEQKLLIKQQQNKIDADKPKVLFAESVETARTSILVGELAKLISQNGYRIGQNRLFDWLRANNYLIKQGERRNQPTQYSMERGLMEIKKRTIDNPDGSIRVTTTTKITGKGQVYFINKFHGFRN